MWRARDCDWSAWVSTQGLCPALFIIKNPFQPVSQIVAALDDQQTVEQYLLKETERLSEAIRVINRDVMTWKWLADARCLDNGWTDRAHA